MTFSELLFVLKRSFIFDLQLPTHSLIVYRLKTKKNILSRTANSLRMAVPNTLHQISLRSFTTNALCQKHTVQNLNKYKHTIPITSKSQTRLQISTFALFFSTFLTCQNVKTEKLNLKDCKSTTENSLCNFIYLFIYSIVHHKNDTYTIFLSNSAYLYLQLGIIMLK